MLWSLDMTSYEAGGKAIFGQTFVFSPFSGEKAQIVHRKQQKVLIMSYFTHLASTISLPAVF